MQGALVMLLVLSGLGCQNPKEAPPSPRGVESGIAPLGTPPADAGASTPSTTKAATQSADSSRLSPAAPSRAATTSRVGESGDVAPPPPIPDAPPLGDAAPGAGPIGEGEISHVPPPPYPVYSGGPFSPLDALEDRSFGTCVRNTFWSFFIGRDPNVPSVRDIEAAYQAGLYNH